MRRRAAPSRLGNAIREELVNLDIRRSLVLSLCNLLPELVANRLRVRLLRLAGVRVGAGTVVLGRITITGSTTPTKNLVIGRDAALNAGCHIDASAPVFISDRAGLSRQVMILTESHEIAGPERRAGEHVLRPVRIGEGAWIGVRAIILPGVTVGAGAVVGAGSVVTKDVEPNTVVAGVPARVIRRLDEPR
jgi:serine acetyltransferase